MTEHVRKAHDPGEIAERVFAGIATQVQAARRTRAVPSTRPLEKVTRQHPHPLERQAAALTNLAVDYALAAHLSISTASSPGQAMLSILRGLEQFEADAECDLAVVHLFAASWEEVSSAPRWDTQGWSACEAAVRGVAGWLGQICRGGKYPPEQAFQELLQLACAVLRGVLRHMVAEDRHVFPAPSARIAEQLAPALLTVFNHQADAETHVICRTIVAAGWTERITAALWRMSQNFPDAFTTETAPVDVWVGRLIADLAHRPEKAPAIEPILIAEAVCQLLEEGMADMPLLVRHPSTKELFLTSALRSLLEVLVAPVPPSGIPLRAVLSYEELRMLLRSMLQAWQAHPDWLYRRSGHQERAATLLPVLVQALTQLEVGILKALLKTGRVEVLLSEVMVSALSGKLSSFNAGKISGILTQVLSELQPYGTTGLALLDKGRLTDLLTAIAASKVADKLFSEAEDTVRHACRGIVAVLQDFRPGQVIAVPELVERLNKKA